MSFCTDNQYVVNYFKRKQAKIYTWQLVFESRICGPFLLFHLHTQVTINIQE